MKNKLLSLLITAFALIAFSCSQPSKTDSKTEQFASKWNLVLAIWPLRPNRPLLNLSARLPPTSRRRIRLGKRYQASSAQITP